jgi:hypothetical protein
MIHVKNTQYLPYAADRNYYEKIWVWSISDSLGLPAIAQPSRAESDLFICPKITPNEKINSSYGYNYLCGFLAKATNYVRWKPVMLTRVSEPSAAVLIADKASPYFGSNLFSTEGEHFSRTQLLLVDGTVKAIRNPEQKALHTGDTDYWYFWAQGEGK